MIQCQEFIDAATRFGYSCFTGVPCSYLTPLLNAILAQDRLRYVGACSEGEAVGIAIGAYLAGQKPVVMAQNSGFGNMVNPLASLNHPFGIPLLLLITWRGHPQWPDEPQHELMGGILHGLLDTLGIAHAPFPAQSADIETRLNLADNHLASTHKPFALILEKGMLEDGELVSKPSPAGAQGQYFDQRSHGLPPTRYELLETLLRIVPKDAALIATTGKTGRELYALADRPQHFYCVGGMGCASAIGLGVSLYAENPVAVLDGDAAALMKLGNMATIGNAKPERLTHIILNNGVHDSTGGQPSNAGCVDFSRVALACGYATAQDCDDTEGFQAAWANLQHRPGPHLIHAQIQPGSIPNPPRPKVSPQAVALRFSGFLSPTITEKNHGQGIG